MIAKTFLQLVWMYLEGGNTVSAIQSSGALHKARWMAKILYRLKIVLLQKDIWTNLIPQAIFGKD